MENGWKYVISRQWAHRNVGMGGMLPSKKKFTISIDWVGRGGGNKKFKWGESPQSWPPLFPKNIPFVNSQVISTDTKGS